MRRSDFILNALGSNESFKQKGHDPSINICGSKLS